MSIVYTDGACSGNPGPGGWACILVSCKDEIIQEFTGNDPETTNNRMELIAIIQALVCDEVSEIRTDSMYCLNGLTKWSKKWAANGWKTSTGQPVKNADLWQEALELYLENPIKVTHVKGHSGDKYNEIVDQMAVNAISELNKY